MINSYLKDKTILVTGGTGSFGKKFVELVLREEQPEVVRVFSRDELKQFEMAQHFNDPRLRFFVGDVRDKERLLRAIDGVDIVVHAAALKQVPSCEYNPFEAIKTNILGAQNVIDASIDREVEKLVFLSSDKAVNPINLYGATKLCAEKLFVQSNSYVGSRKTRIAVVRYGNVVGSRGSVIPLFQGQKKNGVLTLTDERMTRFWITQAGAVNFIINCIEKMKGGEVFVPKLPSMRIIDLAKAMAPEARIEKIGIRPGEKLNEVLLTSEEARHAKEFDNYFVIEPEFTSWQARLEVSRLENEHRANPEGKLPVSYGAGKPLTAQENNYALSGKSIKDGFKYASDSNTHWLSKEELKEMLEESKD